MGIFTGQCWLSVTGTIFPSGPFSRATGSRIVYRPAGTIDSTTNIPCRAKGTMQKWVKIPSGTDPIRSPARTRSPGVAMGVKSQVLSASSGLRYTPLFR
ncbi:MAG: hypothetical protein LUO86_05805, partial [Methanomicrobiales archaeon]|nr:hypothetical protein [Methanomicrobiales archaeon]